MDYTKITFGRQIFGHTLEMAKIFSVFSNIDNVETLSRNYPIDFKAKPLVDLINYGAKKVFSVQYDDFWVANNQKIEENKKNRIVCFSGGKDSTAAAMIMKKEGYNVFLYYVQGINKSYPNEKEKALSIADYLGLPIYIEKVNQKGKTTFHDNPIKNQLIASMALDFAIERSIGTHIVFGDFYTDNIENSSFLESWSDCIEMWDAHEKYVKNYVPTYKIHIPFKNYLETMDIVSKDTTLLGLVQGCVLPHRFRENVKKRNEKKYNVQLLPNRCGSCWKCCTEYIYLAENNVLQLNDKFYEHCLDVLYKKVGILHPQATIKSINDAYKAFLFKDYDAKSILYNKNK